MAALMSSSDDVNMTGICVGMYGFSFSVQFDNFLFLDMTSDFLLKSVYLGITLCYSGSYLIFLFELASSDIAQARKEAAPTPYCQVEVEVQLFHIISSDTMGLGGTARSWG